MFGSTLAFLAIFFSYFHTSSYMESIELGLSSSRLDFNVVSSSSDKMLVLIEPQSTQVDSILLLSEEVINQIRMFKTNAYNEGSGNLDIEETLIALAISAITNPTAKLALDQLPQLKNMEMHSMITLIVMRSLRLMMKER